MHTVWKGSIAFGMVSIPIRLVSATEEKDIQLRQVHEIGRRTHQIQAHVLNRRRRSSVRQHRQGV